MVRRADLCSLLLLYAAFQDGVNGFKPRHWLVATGQFTQDQANCFSVENPRTSSGGGGNPPTNPPSNPPSGNCSVSSPAGSFDYADCNGLGGWSFDQSDLGKTLTVDIYVDGNKVASVLANGDRPDLASHFGNSATRYHGFSYSFPSNASWKNGQNHNITVRICGMGSDLGAPRTVNCSGGATNPSPPSNNNPYYYPTGLIGRSARTSANCQFADCSAALLPVGNGVRVVSAGSEPINFSLDRFWERTNFFDTYYNLTATDAVKETTYSPFLETFSEFNFSGANDYNEASGWMLAYKDLGNQRPDGYMVLPNSWTGFVSI